MMIQEKFLVRGMTCSACSAHVQKAVEEQAGVQSVSVNLLTNSMKVEFDQNAVSEKEIIAAVEQAGYSASVSHKEKNQPEKTAVDIVQKEIQEMQHRFIASLCFLLPLMYVSMGSMIGLPTPAFLKGAENALINVFTQFLFTIPIIVINRQFFVSGFKALVRKAPTMDSLIAIGSAAALVYGVFALYRIAYGLGHNDPELVHRYMMDVYFESAAMILTLITLGKMLETKAKGKTSAAITKLIQLSPKTATVIREETEHEIPVEEIVKGDIILIKPGSTIPVDGIIIEGDTSIDESAITGESIPVEKTVGDTVISASANISGTIRFRAERVGNDTALAQIIALVEEASSSKAQVSQLADKISNYFVPAVIGISVLSFIVWMAAGAGFEFALARSISVLVISCPCALGLATPTAIMAGVGRGARLGILIKSAEAFEAAQKTEVVVLDKTGTITQGNPQLTEILCMQDSYSKKDVLQLAYSLELLSEHPLATAIIKAAETENLQAFRITNFLAEHGKGISGVIDAPSLPFHEKKVFAGNLKLLADRQIAHDSFQTEIEAIGMKGGTPLYIALDKTLIGVLAVSDPIKADSAEAIAELRQMGIRTVMLTGDNAQTAQAIKKTSGVDSYVAELLPQDKKTAIDEIKAGGKITAMVGDGINDAPALTAADIGIAIGSGTEIAIESADIVLMQESLFGAVNAIKLSKAVLRNIKENLFWALFYNTLGIPLAAGALYPIFGLTLSPMFAAAAMSFSSVSVVANAIRLNAFKPKRLSAHVNNTMFDKPADNTQKPEHKSMEEKMESTTIKIEGMSCGHCSARVEKALNALEGVTATVNLEKKEATVQYPESIGIDSLKKAITDAGYEAL
ncbi:heavy metal translocating P-type ATPase [Treponema phagedenis]|uniref:heavy metal translocating P-type ATPase n=1 Tax=Treponema phagedenis TaxID=162 RepID=UPI0001F63C01|nr:heavy metal translocating P-type ATPase [Treponema phagedenis]EFW38132.1 copper-exporting ATPase [Treponema phagedenis F0421]TYT79531.1 heavy metal translocating P-type ATPase [Treponema phagedenis]